MEGADVCAGEAKKRKTKRNSGEDVHISGAWLASALDTLLLAVAVG